jgi:hypothetical protein
MLNQIETKYIFCRITNPFVQPWSLRRISLSKDGVDMEWTALLAIIVEQHSNLSATISIHKKVYTER